MRRGEEQQQEEEEENGQTRTGANHRRARVARPHEVGQQEEQTGGKRSGREVCLDCSHHVHSEAPEVMANLIAEKIRGHKQETHRTR